jgi:hypothetical protein
MNVGPLGLSEHSLLSLRITWLEETHSSFVNKQTVRFEVLQLVTEICSFLGCDAM